MAAGVAGGCVADPCSPHSVAILRDFLRAAVEARIPTTGGLASHLNGLDSLTVAVLAARQPGATGRRLAAFAFLSESEPKTGGDPGRDRERALEKMILAQESDIACTAIAFDARGFLGEADPDLPLVDIGHARQERACAAAVAAGRALDDDGIRVTVAGLNYHWLVQAFWFMPRRCIGPRNAPCAGAGWRALKPRGAGTGDHAPRQHEEGAGHRWRRLPRLAPV